MKWIRGATDWLVARLRPLGLPFWLVRILPGSSRIFGPPRRIISARLVPDLVKEVGIDVSVDFAPIRSLNPVDPFWHRPFPTAVKVRPFVVRDIRARLLAPSHWVVMEPDAFLADTSFWNFSSMREARRWHRIFRRKKPRPERVLDGRVLSLSSDFAPNSYGHWLSDSIPRLLIAERAGLRPSEFDLVLLPGPDSPSVRRLRSLLGVPSPGFRVDADGEDLVVDRLSATSFPGLPGTVSSLAREAAVRLVPPRPPRRRLYLTRDGFQRNPTNASEVQKALEDLGFETCSGSGADSVLDRCAEARIIVGVEGSQCFNALFAPPGGAMVVIVPDGFHPLPYMPSIAGAARLALFLFGARVDRRSGRFEVDIGELRRALISVIQEFG